MTGTIPRNTVAADHSEEKNSQSTFSACLQWSLSRKEERSSSNWLQTILRRVSRSSLVQKIECWSRVIFTHLILQIKGYCTLYKSSLRSCLHQRTFVWEVCRWWVTEQREWMMGRSIPGLLNRCTQRPAHKLPVCTAQVSLSECEKDQLRADSPMLSRSGGMRTQLWKKKKNHSKIPPSWS